MICIQYLLIFLLLYKTVKEDKINFIFFALPCHNADPLLMWTTWPLALFFQIQSIVVFQLLSRVRLFETPWTAARQASLSITISQSLLKLISVESVMPSTHLILCHPLLLPPSIFPSIRVFSNESVLHIRWPKDWSFHFSISPFIEYSGLISFWIDGYELLAV